MELDEYRTDLINDIQAGALVDCMYDDEVFVDYMVEFLRESGNCSDLIRLHYKRAARDSKYKSMEIDGYALEAADNSLYLFASDYNGKEIATVNTDALDKRINGLVSFVENIIKGFFVHEDIEKSTQIYASAMDILEKIANKNVDRIHLIYATTNKIGKKVKLKDIKPIAVKDRAMPVDVTTYDIEDLFKASMSDEQIEPIEIVTKDFECEEGIPCLEADLGETKKYAAYLAIVPGIFLASIYRKYGGKLLESNVRAFLNVKGNVNKGIRNTILTDETKFFTYNNGIACTADSIELNKEKTAIVKMKNFQIVNGGQTTASLANAIVKDNAIENVRHIYVPMKLTVLSEPDPELVGDIAKYANSQNKVTASDLVSNNKYYIEIEKLSRKIYTPKSPTQNYSTLWYFERTRGQYDRDLARCLKKSEKDQFKLVRPKSQLFKKVDLAKYWNSYELKPFTVAWGSEINAANFQAYIDKEYGNKDLSGINEFFYKELIAKAIIFIQTRKITSQTEWYMNNKGILAQVSPHIVSKLVYEVSKYGNGEYMIDLKGIWDRQGLTDTFIKEILRVGECVWKVVGSDDREKINIAEWCKLEKCWELVKKEKYQLSDEFIKELILKTDVEEEKIASKKDQKANNKVEYAVEIFNLGADYWTRVLDRAKLDGVVGYREVELLTAAINSCKKMRLLSNAQAAAIQRIMKTFEEKGIHIKKEN